MRTSWEALHASLSRSIRTLKASEAFRQMKSRHPALSGFAAPGALVAHLTGHPGDLDEKDRLLATLVRQVQHRECEELSSTLLWLGLWPGLDAVYRRRLKHFCFRREELVSELGLAFTRLVDRLALKPATRLAATLVRSTERDVMYGRKRVWATEELTREGHAVSDDLMHSAPEDRAAVQHWAASCAAPVPSLLPELTLHWEPSALRAWLKPVVGDDAELLVAVLVLQESRPEAGMRLGLSPDAARKRFARALGRARQHFSPPQSPSANTKRV